MSLYYLTAERDNHLIKIWKIVNLPFLSLVYDFTCATNSSSNIALNMTFSATRYCGNFTTTSPWIWLLKPPGKIKLDTKLLRWSMTWRRAFRVSFGIEMCRLIKVPGILLNGELLRWRPQNYQFPLVVLILKYVVAETTV